VATTSAAGTSDDANVMGVAGFVLLTVGRDVDSGLPALRRATELNPNNALVSNLVGTANMFAGDLAEARGQLERARRLSPRDPAAFLFLSGLACVELLMGRAREALACCVESANANPDWDFTWWVIAAIAGELGQDERARRCDWTARDDEGRREAAAASVWDVRGRGPSRATHRCAAQGGARAGGVRKSGGWSPCGDGKRVCGELRVTAVEV
jgi:predicted Zn-dependent protease